MGKSEEQLINVDLLFLSDMEMFWHLCLVVKTGRPEAVFRCLAWVCVSSLIILLGLSCI